MKLRGKLKTYNYYKNIVLVLVLLICNDLFSQDYDKFTVFGKFKVEDGNFDFSKIVITKDGAVWKSLKGKKSFEFNLDFNHEYIFSFEKRGYVSKKIKVDTRVSPELLEEGFEPFQFYVNIFKQYEGVNTVVYNQPVGIIKYNASIDDFDYDTDYTKSIRSQIKKVEEETEKAKEKEEVEQKEIKKQEIIAQKQAADAAARLKAEEEKAKLLAEQEEKKKIAEEKARLAEAKRKADEEAKRKQEEEKARIEAEIARQKAETEAAKQKAKQEAKRKADEEKAKLLAEEQAREKERIEAEKQRLALEEKMAKANEEEAKKAKAEMEELKEKEKQRKLAEQEAERKKKEIEQKQRQANQVAENEAKKKREKLIEEEQKRKMALAIAEEEKRRKLNASFEEEERRVDNVPRTVSTEYKVEHNKKITLVTVSEGKEVNVYRKVEWSWGGVYYFKNSENISVSIFFEETK